MYRLEEAVLARGSFYSQRTALGTSRGTANCWNVELEVVSDVVDNDEREKKLKIFVESGGPHRKKGR